MTDRDGKTTVGAGARAQSLPPATRPSAEHVRALDAATALDLRLFKKFAQRPLMSVWDGEDTAGGRVLLTVLDACGTPTERARILEAAHALDRVSAAPGVQHVHRVVDAVDAFVSDFLGAGSAADLVVLRWPAGKRVDFMLRICEAVGALHSAGIVHGCLCPDNVLMNDDLQPVLSEVGMVSVKESLAGDPENFFGYGAYTAPDAKQGAPTKESDIFSLGRLLSFVMLDHVPDEAAPFAEIDKRYPELAAIHRRCVAPTGRYASVTELLVELKVCQQKLVTVEGAVALRAPEARVAPRPARPADKAAAPAAQAWSQDAPAPKTGAPAWVAMASGLLVIVLCGVGKVLLISSGVVHLGLEALVAVAAVGMTAAIQLTAAKRAALSVAVLVATFVIDPAGQLSRFEAADLGTRGEAARAFVQKGGKDLHNKQFQRADLSGLNLADADLRGADVTAASFAGSKLTNAQVDGATLMLANLVGADLTGVALERARGAETAHCDATTVPPAGWSCGETGKLRHAPSAP